MLELQHMYENCLLLEGLSLEEIDALKPQIRKFDKGSAIVKEGDVISHFGIVLSGEVQVFNTDMYGNRNIILTERNGFIFGESLSVLGIEKFPVSIVASDNSEIMFLSSDILFQGNNAKIMSNLLKIMAKTNIEYRQKLTLLGNRTTRDKILYYLSEEAKKNKSRSFHIPFDRQELADFLGVERSAMSAEIGKLVKDGIIRTEKSWFQLIRN